MAASLREPGIRGTSTSGRRYQAEQRSNVTDNSRLCVIAICEVLSRAVSKSPINPIINPNPVYSHTHKRDNKLELQQRDNFPPVIRSCISKRAMQLGR
jgi:hypothetical protein